MAFDWEGILGAEGGGLQEAYDRELEHFDRMEHGWQRPAGNSACVINWLPGDRWPAPEDDGQEHCEQCDGNCDEDCSTCRYHRSIFQNCDNASAKGGQLDRGSSPYAQEDAANESDSNT